MSIISDDELDFGAWDEELDAPCPTRRSTYMGDHTFGGHRAARTFYQCRQCEHVIAPKQRYWYGVAMPGADANSGNKPWVLRICSSCKPEDSRRPPL